MPGHGQRLLVPKTEEKRVAPCDGAPGRGGGDDGGGEEGGGSGGSRVAAGARSYVVRCWDGASRRLARRHHSCATTSA
ncbi:hypothetical protein AOQ73_12635 [Bradyrhizobium pachyrhizi]|nr:hypothetical protein AOQ73_12635 [Bradyrhizobium pachyrhizi]